jgi:Xaa-Pro aminopeptidase
MVLGSADAGGALVRAMRDMGLWKGRIAFDHLLTAAICERHGHPGELVPGDNILRWIRLVKSPLEIRLMRRAAAANVAAVDALGQSIRAGASHAELKQQFEIEAARRGNRALFLTVDRASSVLSDEVIRDGQAFFIDGVSHFHHYHGDYARTVFVGEPLPAARAAAQAVAHAWQAVREELRPGLTYTEIVALGQEAVRKGGFKLAIGFGPHSVGLMHTDEPGDDKGGFYGKLDLTLCENMVLSVDCPVLNTGVGGSAHIEDLMLITADGAEPLHDLGEPVITV